MSFEYQDGQVTFDVAWKSHKKTPLVDLLGSVDDSEFITNQNISVRSYNPLVRFMTGSLIRSTTINLSNLSGFTLQNLVNIKNISNVTAQEIYELYATHATLSLYKPDQNEETENSRFSSIIKEWNSKDKEFRVFQIDGVTYLKLETNIIPMAVVIDIYGIEAKNSLHFLFHFIAQADHTYFGNEYKKGQVVKYNTNQSGHCPDETEVRKLIAVLNNFAFSI